MSKIKIMSTSLANKIAAGEVVEKCASVVKELVENSIDAKSTEIKIELIESGTKSIKVTDNGIGMDKEDAKMCFMPHATSKLYDEDDLFNINTLGFRGEALPSIASVSDIILKTTYNDESIIYYLEGGKIVKEENSDLTKGTSIEVKNLFYNTPARLKYLSSLYSELANISTCVQREALSHTDIRFTLINDGKIVFKTDGRGNLLKTINDIYGIKVSKNMLKIEGENDDYEVSGFISLPDINKSSRNHMITFVNNRFIKNTEINRTIFDAYRKFKPDKDNRYPICILNITVDTSLVDVNIHPSKMDAKFSNIEELKELIASLITNRLFKTELSVDVTNHEIKAENFIKEDKKEEKVTEYTMDFSMSENLIKETEEEYIYQDLDLTNEKIEEKEKPFPNLFVSGQVLGTYIVCHNEEGMYLIDQHAAEERVNYEKFKEKMRNPVKDTIKMLFPINIEYPKDEFIIIKNKIDFIRDLGIEIEEFGESSYIIKSHPTWYKEGYEELFIRSILEGIINMNKNFDIEKFTDSITQMMSCKASIRANTPLSIEEMQRIVDDLSKCKNPYNCAHGRPSIIHYPKYELEKLFKRVM